MDTSTRFPWINSWENRDFRDSCRDSTGGEVKDARNSQESREKKRERDGGRDRERDRGDRERESVTREKRNSKPEVPVVPLVDHRSGEEKHSKPEVPVAPLVDHRSGEEKQRARSSQDLKHPRSAVLAGVIVPLLSEVIIFKYLYIFTKNESGHSRTCEPRR